jgi:signal transduction histidine kinase
MTASADNAERSMVPETKGQPMSEVDLQEQLSQYQQGFNALWQEAADLHQAVGDLERQTEAVASVGLAPAAVPYESPRAALEHHVKTVRELTGAHGAMALLLVGGAGMALCSDGPAASDNAELHRVTNLSSKELEELEQWSATSNAHEGTRVPLVEVPILSDYVTGPYVGDVWVVREPERLGTLCVACWGGKPPDPSERCRKLVRARTAILAAILTKTRLVENVRALRHNAGNLLLHSVSLFDLLRHNLDRLPEELQADVKDLLPRAERPLEWLRAHMNPASVYAEPRPVSEMLGEIVEHAKGSCDCHEVIPDNQADTETAVCLDHAQCTQVFENVFRNIANHAWAERVRDHEDKPPREKPLEARTVSITVRTKRRWVLIEVTDNGLGFDPLKVFKVLHEGSRTGMPSSRQKVEEAGGHMAIEPTPGVGTTVTIMLPRVRRRAVRPPQKSASQAQ